MEVEKEINTIFIDDNRNIIDYRAIIDKYLSHWKLFLICIFGALLIAFAYLRYTPLQFLVNTTILIEEKSSGGLASDLFAFEDMNGLGRNTKSVINEIGVLNSRTLIEDVVKELNLNVRYYSKGRLNNSEIYKYDVPFNINFFVKDSIFFNLDTTFVVSTISKTSILIKSEDNNLVQKSVFGKNIESVFGRINITPKNPENIVIGETVIVKISKLARIVDSYRGRIQIEPQESKSSILILSLVDPIKSKAVDILDAVVSKYNNEAINFKNIITKNTDDFINDRIAKIYDDLSNVDRGVEDFKTLNKLTDIEFETNLDLESNSEIEDRIVDLTSQIRLIDYVSEYINENKSDLIPSNLGLKDRTTMESSLEYNKLMMERNRIILSSSIRNPTVINLDAQIESMRNNIEQSLTNLRKSLAFSLREARIQESNLNKKRNLAPQQEREFQDIKRRQKIVETIYLYLLQKREENAIKLGLPVPNAVIIDKANGSEFPVAPKGIVIYISAILLGFMFPFLIITIQSLLDNKIHTIDGLKALINAPILGDIPYTRIKNKIVVTSQGSNNISESFRLIRTNLNFLIGNSSSESNAIFLTSTIGNEGKTFIALNLATSLASINKKVLLVCADLRKPKVNEYLKIKSSIGLSHYLVDNNLGINDIIDRNNKVDFDIVQSGEIPPNPAELLINGRFDEVIAYGKENYDYVIVDTPPVNLITDTLLISHLADMFIYIVRANYLDKHILISQKEMFKEKRLPNLALLLNGTDDFKRGYRYGYGENQAKK